MDDARERIAGHGLGPDAFVITASTLGNPPFDVLVAAARRGGFAGLSIWPAATYDPARRAGWRDADLRRVLDDNGLAVQDVDAWIAWVGPDDPGPPYLEEASRAEIFAAADALRARFVNVVLVGPYTSSVDAAAQTLAPMCDEAAEHGLGVTLEYSMRGVVSGVADAIAVVHAVDRPNAFVLVDTWHHHWGASARDDLAVAPGPLVAAVQVSDAPTTTPADLAHATRRGRLLPGRGGADLVGMVHRLRASGCRAPLTAEVLNDELLAVHGPLAFAELVGAALRAVEQEAQTTSDA